MIKAIVLGLVQGLTEFLPVSSSGHLVVVPYLLSWEQPPLPFDVALHFGTLLAVIGYFAGDLWFLATRSFSIGTDDPAEVARARRTVGLLALGTIPAAAVGYLVEPFFEGTLDAPQVVAGGLLATGGLLYAAEFLRRRRAADVVGVSPKQLAVTSPGMDVGRDEGTVGWGDALVIGFGQALAILPGISRSGATIVAGMVRGLSREGAARFSFLLSIPVILGATAFKLPELFDGDAVERAYSNGEIAVGTLVAAAAGWWAIRFLLRVVQTDDLTGFARYVLLLGALTFIGSLWLGPPSSI